MGTALSVCCFALVCAGAAFLLRGERHRSNLAYMVGYWLGYIGASLDGHRVNAIITGAFALYFTWAWWRGGGGKNLKKTTRQLGEKSKARLAALVDQMTPAPVPGGAA